MIDNINILYTPDPSPDHIKSLEHGLTEHAQLKKNQKPIENFGFFIPNESQDIIGGCAGIMYYGCLEVSSLWVDETFRNKKIGTRLMEAAEQLGRERGCLFSSLDTMDWQALGFYQKLGYTVEYERTGYFYESTLYYLKKSL